MSEKENRQKSKEPRYVISVASRIVGIETHTLRYYERIGLVQPYRSGGNVRYYSESDIEQLHYIRKLVNELGVNPAGVEVVFRMAKLMNDMQSRIEKLTDELEQARGEQPQLRKQKERNNPGKVKP
jgi:MerR family transcriptional regulator/heat shock protein HspR